MDIISEDMLKMNLTSIECGEFHKLNIANKFVQHNTVLIHKTFGGRIRKIRVKELLGAFFTSRINADDSTEFIGKEEFILI
jgi:hypothetical protein